LVKGLLNQKFRRKPSQAKVGKKKKKDTWKARGGKKLSEKKKFTTWAGRESCKYSFRPGRFREGRECRGSPDKRGRFDSAKDKGSLSGKRTKTCVVKEERVDISRGKTRGTLKTQVEEVWVLSAGEAVARGVTGNYTAPSRCRIKKDRANLKIKMNT